MALEEQTEAVFKSTRMNQDPVSGNEVPTGSLPEEVRDDIPARLSEGEYVVPADVVRYYGIKFFEDLRSEAKSGWQSMEQNGRIGGEPMAPEGMEMVEPEDADFPFDVSELQTIEAFEGKYISGYGLGGDVDRYTPTSISKKEKINYSGGTDGMGSGSSYFDVRKYVNRAGNIIYITFMNGKPINVIPEGYYPEGELPEQDITETSATVEQDDGSDYSGGDSKEEPTNWYDQYDLKSKVGINEAIDDLTSESKDTTGISVLFGPLGAAAMGLATANKLAKARGIVEQVKLTDAELAAELEAKIDARMKDTTVAKAIENISPTLIDGSTYSEELKGLVSTTGEPTAPTNKDKNDNTPPKPDPLVEQTEAIIKGAAAEDTIKGGDGKDTLTTTDVSSGSNKDFDKSMAEAQEQARKAYADTGGKAGYDPKIEASTAPESASKTYVKSTSSAGDTTTPGGKSSQSYKEQEDDATALIYKGGLMKRTKKKL